MSRTEKIKNMFKLIYKDKPNYERLEKYGIIDIVEDLNLSHPENNKYIVYLEKKPF